MSNIYIDMNCILLNDMIWNLHFISAKTLLKSDI